MQLRTWVQMVLLAAEQHLGVREIAAIVRECEGTVRCWLKCYRAHGIEGPQDLWTRTARLSVAPRAADGHARRARWAVRGTFLANSDVFHSQDMPQTPALR